MSTSEIILNYADGRRMFKFSDLSDYIRSRESENISDSAILWHIKKLISNNKIARISRGIYGTFSKKEYVSDVSPEYREIYNSIRETFPLIDICTYAGKDIESMQHHLSENNAQYIEVLKEAAEAVFHYLLDKGIKAYHRPNAQFMSEYVDLSEKCVIVKPLISESPVMTANGVITPTLEKLLVDINADADFYYLRGGETYRIMEYARTMYHINEPKMLRYASRRGIKEEITEILKNTERK